MIRRETLELYMYNTGIVIISNSEATQIEEDLFNIEINNKKINFNNMVLYCNELIYDKKNRKLLDREKDITIRLNKDEYFILEEDNENIYITIEKFSSEILNGDNVQYPLFETSIVNNFDNSTISKIHMRYSLSQLEEFCLFNRKYIDHNSAIHETMYYRRLMEENQDKILKIKYLLERGEKITIIINGEAYNLFNLIDSILYLIPLDINKNILYLELCDILNCNNIYIINDIYVVYDGSVYRNNKLVKDDAIPKTLDGTYFKTVYNFYLNMKYNEEEGILDEESMECVKNDIINNFKEISDKERDENFNRIIDKGIAFVEKNDVILIDRRLMNEIDDIINENKK